MKYFRSPFVRLGAWVMLIAMMAQIIRGSNTTAWDEGNKESATPSENVQQEAKNKPKDHHGCFMTRKGGHHHCKVGLCKSAGGHCSRKHKANCRFHNPNGAYECVSCTCKASA
ncbi:hypothetical protein O181_075761 [Austropuccinia psidii MF-1]|uniref:Uncharacterized protein n=1 Tax=Austropuccinia psidii MF-1 TaxID=1389203 RepID=A0A9Q3FF45_9BASI|nr:hypothetical protein [Austropuccinia psidii MF-1]